MKWRQVVGFEGRYEVSSSGQIKSLSRGRNRLLRPGKGSNGYLTVVLFVDRVNRKSKTVHSIVCEAFIGPRPDGLVINHKDGDKTNNAASNLEYVTYGDNRRHAFDCGLTTSSIPRKLTDKQARMVVRVMQSNPPKGTAAKLARRFGINQGTISNIMSGSTYFRTTGISPRPR